MSLRDQLLSKGLVSKKRARSADRDKKRDRKRDKGSRDKKRIREEAERAAQEAESNKRREEKQSNRARYARERERMERALRARQILQHHRVKARGRVAYHHTTTNTGQVARLWVDEATAFRLRNGEFAIAAEPSGGGFVILPASVADRLKSFAAELVVWHVQDTTGLSAPDLAICVYDGETCLRARRWLGESTP